MSSFIEFAHNHPSLPYRFSEGMTFNSVVVSLKVKDGAKFARKGWNGTGMYIMLQVPDKDSKMGRPYIYMRDAQGICVPWLASQTDMLCSDWYEVEE